MAAVGPKGILILSAVFYLLCTVQAAPVDEGGPSHALQLSESIADARGCYYNFEHYGEGDRILTNEPCLNCTCHNRMLMCYLRVCPFTKAIGQDCTVEKKPDQCCPIITCPQVPVALLTSSTTSETPPTTTALGRPDNYGCILEDNTFYADGAQVPSDPRKPCELCYCIRNHTACVMQECTLNVEGCKPVYQEGICCPVRYDCDYDDVATTPKPTIGLVTTPGGPSDCLHNARIYHDGAMVMKDEKAPCEHCYCMRGDIVCAVQECGTPLEGTDCIPMERKHGQCCPNYKCANGTNSIGSGESSTEILSQSSTTESYEHVKQDSGEDSTVESFSNESSEESQEESASGTSKPIGDEHESMSHTQETSPTYAPDQPSVSDESSVSSAQEQYTKRPENNEIVTTEVPLQENNLQQVGDSISEATQEQDVTHVHEVTTNHEDNQDKGVINEQETVHESTPKTEDETTEKQNVNPDQDVILEEEPVYVQEAAAKPEVSHAQETAAEQEVTYVQETENPEANHVKDASGEQQAVAEQELTTKNPAVVKDSEVTNEIPESTPSEHSETTTEQPASEAARVPGEGSCLIEGKTYAHDTIIPSENPCQESCRCYSSIVSCKPKDCPPAPTQFEHCMPINTPGSCCPTYMCDQKPSDAPEVQNQLVDKIDDPSSAEQEDEHVGPTQETSDNEHKDLANGPVVEGIPPENLVPGSHEDEIPEAQPQEVPEVLTVEQSGASTDIPSSNIHEDDNVNSDVVHGLDVAIHEGHLDPTENKDESANRPSSPEITTVEPVKSDDNTQDIATPLEPEPFSVSTADKDAVQVEEVTQKQESYTVLHLDDELPQTPFYITTNRPNEEETVRPQATGNIGSENVETNYSEISATAINYEPEVTTFYQDLQENQEHNTPTTVDSQPGENSDSIIDESKQVENLATSKPLEVSTYSEVEGEVHTEPSQYITSQHTTEISDSVSFGEDESQIKNDSEQSQTNQEQTTISQQNVYSEGVLEVSSETSINSDNGESNDLPNGISDEIPNVGSEESVPAEETSSPQEDAVTTANHISLVSEGSEATATLLPEVNDETPTPYSEEVSNAISSNEKSTEASTSQADGEENEKNSYDLEPVQTTIRYETEFTSEKLQAASEGQELNNAVSSSTETATSGDGTTVLPLSNGDDKTDEKIVESTTFYQVKEEEQTSEEIVHSNVSHDPSVPSGEPQFEENSIHEISGQEVVTGQTTSGSGTETSTEVKSEESASEAPLEVTASIKPQDDDENNLHKDSSPEIIFEVVTNSGMPSIESHVTEGTLDHSIHQINNLVDKDTQHTTENSQTLKTPSIEEPSSYDPPNPEILIQIAPTTNEPVAEQSTDPTTVNSQKVPSIEDAHNEATSTHHETSTEKLFSDLAPTTPIPNQVGLSHQVNQEEISQNTNEASHETPEMPLQTTVPPEIVKENDNSQASSEQVSSDSISEANEKIDSTQNEVQIPVSDDEKNEIAPPEVHPTDLPSEEPQHVSTGEVTTESANNEVPDEKTTAISPLPEAIQTEIQNEPSLEDNSEADSINHPQTDTPSLEENVDVVQVEQKPSYLQPETEDGPHVPQESTSIANEELSTSLISTIEDKAVTNSPVEISQSASHDEIVQELTTETTHHTQQENVSEDKISAVETLDVSKQSVTEVTPETVTLPSSSESPELSLSNNKETMSEVTPENLLEVKPEKNATPSVSSIDEENSTSHVEAIPQTDNTEASSINTPEDTPQLQNGSEDSEVAQVTHVENVVPPAPDSESHILETSTKATEENTLIPQATLDNHQDETIQPEQLHPNEIKTDQAENEQVKPDKTPTNEVEIEQLQTEEIPSNQVETDLPHIPEVPDTETSLPDEIPTNQVVIEQASPDEVPSKPVESEQPHTDETTTIRVEPEQSLPDEVPTNQVEAEQSLPDEIKTDQAETEQTHSDEIEQHTTNEIPINQVEIEQSHNVDIPTNQVETDQPHTSEVPSAQVETEQSHTDEVPTNQIVTEGPQYAEVPMHHAQTEQPQTNEEPEVQVQTEQPLTAEVPADQVLTEKPLTAEAPADQVQTEKPLTAEVPADQVQTEQPLTAEVPEDHVQTEQPLNAEVPTHQVQTEQPLPAEVPANQVQTEQPLTAEVPADQVQTEQPLTAEVPADQVQTEQPLTAEVPADRLQTEQPLPAELPADQVQTEQPLTVEVPADQVQTEQPLTAEVPADQVQTEKPLTAEIPADQVHADETPVNHVETAISPSGNTPTDQVETEQPHTSEVPADQVQTEQLQTALVPDQIQTGQSHTDIPVNEAETGLSPSEEIPTDQSQTESDSNILHSEDEPEVPVTNVPDSTEKLQEIIDHEVSSMHPDKHTNFTTQKPFTESAHVESSQTTEHSSPSDVNSQTTPKEPTLVPQKIEADVGTEKPDEQKPVTESILTPPEKLPEDVAGSNQPTYQSANGQTVSHSTDMSILTEILSSTLKPSPVYHEEGPSFPTWSQKPFEHHTTPEPHPPEESHYPNGFDPEYEDEEGVSYGPGTCRYGGKVYLSAQQIPRDDPCDFCFCFRSDIICLQQSCPPPIRGCYQETIKGFCCPRYECHVSMATMLNITTTTTTTTTTLPPHFFAHAYNGAATKAGCQVKDVAYSVGERIPSTSGPCLECRCGANGQMKCDPTVCGPQEALLRQVMDAAVSRRR